MRLVTKMTTNKHKIPTIIKKGIAIGSKDKIIPAIAKPFLRFADADRTIPINAKIILSTANTNPRTIPKIIKGRRKTAKRPALHAPTHNQIVIAAQINAAIPHTKDRIPNTRPAIFFDFPILAKSSDCVTETLSKFDKTRPPHFLQEPEPASSSAPQKLQFIKILLSKSDTLIISQNLTKIKLFG